MVAQTNNQGRFFQYALLVFLAPRDINHHNPSYALYCLVNSNWQKLLLFEILQKSNMSLHAKTNSQMLSPICG